MRDRSTSTWMMAAVWLLAAAGPARSLAQPPALPSPARPSPVAPATPPGAAAPESDGRSGGAPSPLAARVRLDPAPFAPGDLRFPISLATALRLSDARPLIVAAAQARVWVAEGELARAKVLWVPDLVVGFAYVRHDGGGPDFNKGIMTAPSVNWFFGGAGLNTVLG